MKPTIDWEVKRITPEGAELERIQVVLEEPLAVELNSQQVAVLMRLPGQEKELAVGYCLSEGLITDGAAIQMVHHCGRGLPSPDEAGGPSSRNRVQLTVDAAAVAERSLPETARLVRSGCGAADVTLAQLSLPTVESDVQVSAQVVLMLNKAMREGQGLFQDIGAVHAAALFDLRGELVVLAEDVGRHNAMDKVIGYCALRRIPLADKIMATSGRASYEMVAKTVRVGIPIVASVSSPTSLAAQIAERYGATLIGYMRGQRFSVYAHGERIASVMEID